MAQLHNLELLHYVYVYYYYYYAKYYQLLYDTCKCTVLNKFYLSIYLTVESLNARLAMCGPAEKILVFDRYDDPSVRQRHERQRRVGVGST